MLAVRNGSHAIDIILYNHASFANQIVDCDVTVNVAATSAGEAPDLLTTPPVARSMVPDPLTL